MTEYRLIHYVPDHVNGTRFPIGAALAREGGAVLVESGRIPSPSCLGGDSHAAALSMLLEGLRTLTSLDRLPSAVGPHAVLDAARQIPVGVLDPVRWLREQVLNPLVTPTATGRHVSHHRSSFGAAFFRRWGVDKYVQKSFEPLSHGARWFKVEGNTLLKPITHWVQGSSGGGKTRIFLMEPIVATRSSLQRDLKDIGSQFLAYRWAIDQVKSSAKLDAALIAYVIRGGGSDSRSQAIDAMHAAAHRVVDAENASQAERFTQDIKKLALSSQSQGELGLAN